MKSLLVLAVLETEDRYRASSTFFKNKKKLDVTKHSKRAHSYVRRPLNFKAPFCFFWADGHSHDFSKSELYFSNFDGTIYKLPYTMEGDFAKPERISQ